MKPWLGRLLGRPPPTIQARFDATSSNRRLRTWIPSSENLNSLLSYGGEALIRRSRDLVRNNPYAANAARVFSSATVGYGITPSSRVPDPQFKAEIDAAFADWTDEADADWSTDFYGLQALTARGLFEGGEAFWRERMRLPSDGLAVPLQYQLLEAEMLPWEKNEVLPNGNVIRCGIELSPIGKRVAYWFYRRHPGDSTDRLLRPEASTWVRVPASQVIHVYQVQRPGQLRGVPYLTPAMIRLRLLDDYDDAELERKRQAANFVGFVKSPSLDSDPIGEDPDEGLAEAPIAPGQMRVLLPGEDITFSEPADVGGNFEAFEYRVLLAISAATGIPYSLLTNDMRQTNYSSTRSAIVEFRKQVEQFQYSTLIYQLCRVVWRRWLQVAQLSGAIALPNAALSPELIQAVQWLPPRWDWIDPEKDAKAEILSIRAGLKSRTQAVTERGYDIAKLDAEIAQERARAREMELTFPELDAEQMAQDSAEAAAEAQSNTAQETDR